MVAWGIYFLCDTVELNMMVFPKCLFNSFVVFLWLKYNTLNFIYNLNSTTHLDATSLH